MNPRLVLVETWEEAEEFRSWLGERRPFLAIDTETTGLEFWTPHFLRTVQFGDGETGWCLSWEWWGRLIKESVEFYDREIVMQNAKFDIHSLESVGIKVPTAKLHDTQVMAWLLHPDQSTSLKPLAKKYIDPSSQDGQSRLQQAFRANGWTWATVPVDFGPYWSYAALDTCLTALLAEKLLPQLTEQNLTDAYEMEMAVMHVLAAAETRGVRLDIPYTSQLQDEWDTKIYNAAEKLHQAGIENPNADRQIAEALQMRGWEPDEYTATGFPSVKELVLKGIDSEIATTVIEYRKLRKWTHTYLEAFLQRQDNGVLHANIRPLKARTGRMSITDPPLQTLPRGPEIRNCIIPSPGRKLLAIDFSNIELRLLAHFAQEQPMLEAFEKGFDFHGDTARRLYGADFTPQQRSICKNGNFAKVYGAGVRKFAKTAEISESEAESFMLAYDKTYPGVGRFLKEVEQIGISRLNNENEAYVRTFYGHKLPSDPDKVYTLTNYLCQGTAAGVLKKAILDLDAAGLADRLLLPVHDELIFDIDPEEWDNVVPEIQETMEDHKNFRVPLTVSVSGQLDRWGDNAK